MQLQVIIIMKLLQSLQLWNNIFIVKAYHHGPLVRLRVNTHSCPSNIIPNVYLRLYIGGGYQAWIVQENIMSITGKFLFSLMYSVFVVFVTAFVMVLVHERVPDSTSYPPLPDIVLDNVTHMPFAFTLVEVCCVLPRSPFSSFNYQLHAQYRYLS
jgi:tryptophan-rich sensory protein